MKKEKAKRMTVREVRARLELQSELDQRVLEQQRSALPSFQVMRDVERARARMSFCDDLLKEMSVHRKEA